MDELSHEVEEVTKEVEELTIEAVTEIAAPKRSQPWIALIVSVLVLGAIVLIVERDLDKIRAFIAGSGWVGLVTAVLLYGLLGLSPIPSEPLTVLLSTIFGPFSATLAAGFGNLLAAIIEYFLGSRIGAVADFESRKEKMPFGLGRFPVDSAVFLLGARMLPGYGPKLVSLISGVYRVPILRYIWTAAVPTFIGAAIFAYGGAGLLHLTQ
ncbi:MAG TPA: VTT domain-containing protein [Anaerolineaceae bacterium]